MRIAISGAVCTGKTTLGKALAERLGLPFIEENLDSLFGRRSTSRRTAEDTAGAIVARLENKRKLETEAGSFVIDRSPLDLINFWQSGQVPRQCAGHDIYDLCESHMAFYHFVILTPYGGIPFVQAYSSGVQRVMNEWIRFNGSVRITGLAHHFVDPDRIILIPRALSAHDERLAFVLDTIRSRRGK